MCVCVCEDEVSDLNGKRKYNIYATEWVCRCAIVDEEYYPFDWKRKHCA